MQTGTQPGANNKFVARLGNRKASLQLTTILLTRDFLLLKNPMSINHRVFILASNM